MAAKTLNSSCLSNQGHRKASRSRSSKLRSQAIGSNSVSKSRPSNSKPSSIPDSRRVFYKSSERPEYSVKWRAIDHDKKKSKNAMSRDRSGNSRTPQKEGHFRAMRSGSKSNSVRRCLKAFMVGHGPCKGQSIRRTAAVRLDASSSFKSPAVRGQLGNQRWNHASQPNTAKGWAGTGGQRGASYEGKPYNSGQRDLAQRDQHPVRLAQGVGQDSKTSLMTAITIKTQGNNQGRKRRSPSKKSAPRSGGLRGRRSSAS